MNELKKHLNKIREHEVIELFKTIHDFEKNRGWKAVTMYIPTGEARALFKRVELLRMKYPKHLFSWSAEKIGLQYFRKLIITQQ